MAGQAIATMLNVSLRMTIDAPGHPHRCNASDPVHCLYRAMTLLAFEPRLDVSLMSKVNKVGKVVNLDPRNGFAIFPIGCELHDFVTVADARYRFVTSHTFANAGYAGDGRPVCVDVTVLTRNLIVRGVNRVAEFDRLDRTAVRKIFTVYPSAGKKTDHDHEPKQGWFFRGPKRIEHRD
jgi:hypothetical protein